MEKKQIMIVEDERIVAEDIKYSVQNLGYVVPALVSSGEEAMKKVAENKPDLVMMDIKLKGEMDGIEAAEQIRFHFNIPVVYLTAHSDEETLRRAKITEPFGYIIKPFSDRDLQINIEIALYKWEMERKLKESEKWFSTTLGSISDAVIATDKKGLVSFMNPTAEKLTGWNIESAEGKPVKDVLNIANEETDEKMEDPVAKVIKEGSVVPLTDDTILMAKDGTKRPIEAGCSPIEDDKENIIGTVLVFRDITQRKQAEQLLKKHAADLERSNVELRQALDELLKRVDKSHEYVSAQEIKAGIENLGGVFLYPIQDEERVRSIFLSMVDVGLPTLAVVRTPPRKFQEVLGRDVETVWLTTNRVPDMVCVDPLNIERLSIVLVEFFEHAPEGVVLFEGVEYLLSIVGFKNLLNFIQFLSDKIARCEGAIYMLIDMDVLEEKEARYILRECLPPPETNKAIEAQDKGQ